MNISPAIASSLGSVVFILLIAYYMYQNEIAHYSGEVIRHLKQFLNSLLGDYTYYIY